MREEQAHLSGMNILKNTIKRDLILGVILLAGLSMGCSNDERPVEDTQIIDDNIMGTQELRNQ